MEYLLVVYILMNGNWVRGDEIEGWASIAYASEQICLERKASAEALQVELKTRNPQAYDKRFECEPRESEPSD